MTHALASGSKDWNKYLPLLQLAFNTAVSATTGYSPFFVNNLRHAILPVVSASITRDARRAESLPEWVASHLDRLQVTYNAVSTQLKRHALSAKRAWDLKHDTQLAFADGGRVRMNAVSVIDGVHPKAVEPTLGPFTVC